MTPTALIYYRAVFSAFSSTGALVFVLLLGLIGLAAMAVAMRRHA